MNWEEYFLRIAELIAKKSKDRSKKIGAIIVGEGNEIRSTGFNGFPRGVNDDVDDRHDRPAKYAWTEHGARARRSVTVGRTTTSPPASMRKPLRRERSTVGCRLLTACGGLTVGRK